MFTTSMGLAIPYELRGSSELAHQARAAAERAAALDRAALILAPQGFNAEAVARWIHAHGPRAGHPFLLVSSAGADPQLLERRLFGNLRRDDRDTLELLSTGAGLLDGQGGTLFIDLVADLSAAVQRRLARVARDGEARLSRPSRRVRLDVRLLASASPGFPAQVEEGRFRADLARRFDASVEISPLRARRSDVPGIAEAILAELQPSRRFTPAALTVLSALPWRHNIAELRELLERLVAGDSESVIRQEDVLAEVQLERPHAPMRSLREARRHFERDYIAAVLHAHGGRMQDAARVLGIERANLYRKARQLGIQLTPRGSRSSAARSIG